MLLVSSAEGLVFESGNGQFRNTAQDCRNNGKAMARKEKQWEVEDKNLRTMGTENSRQIQIRIYGHHFLGGGRWCPFTPASICMQAEQNQSFKCCGYFVLSEFGVEFFVIWIRSIFVPSPISGLPEFEVTRVGV